MARSTISPRETTESNGAVSGARCAVRRRSGGARGWPREARVICTHSSRRRTSHVISMVVALLALSLGSASAQTGTISGLVTDTNGIPQSSVTVQAFDADGKSVAIVSTSNVPATLGTYVTGSLSVGNYYVRATVPTGSYLVGELYNDIPCTFSPCTPTTGTAVSVYDQQTTDVSFVLTLGGRISGVVSDVNGTPIAGVNVLASSSSNPAVSISAITNALGFYSVPSTGMAPANYNLRTINALGYVNEVYDDLPCAPTCNVTAGTPVAVTGGQTTTNINLALVLGNRITGIVSDLNDPIVGVNVQAINSTNGAVAAAAATAAGGAYTISGLLAGTYLGRTVNQLGYLDEVFDNVLCPQCAANVTAAGGTPIVFNGQGETAANTNFVLARGGQITGRVTDATTGAGIGNMTVVIMDASGRQLVTTTTSNLPATLGNYGTTGLLGGTYLARILGSPATPYVPEVFDNLTCVPCRVTDGTPIEVTIGVVTSNVNFALDAGGRLSGTIRDSTTLLPLTTIFVDVFNSSGVNVGFTTASGVPGTFTSVGLPAGNYVARTRALQSTAPASQGYVNEVYNNVTCSGCNPLSGSTPIAVNVNQITPNIDFLLDWGARIAGHVQDDGTGQPIQNVFVQLFNSRGLQASIATTNASGDYLSPEGLAPGNYHAGTSNGLGYINELFDGLRCPGGSICTPTSGMEIPVGAPDTVADNVDFSLQLGGRIAGMITDAATLAPLGGVSAVAYNTAGIAAGGGVSDATGAFITSGLLPGTYHVGTNNSIGRVNEVYSDTPCLGCDPAATGVGVAVAQGTVTPDINFELDTGGRVSGVVAGAGGTALQGVTVEIYANPAGRTPPQRASPTRPAAT